MIRMHYVDVVNPRRGKLLQISGWFVMFVGLVVGMSAGWQTGWTIGLIGLVLTWVGRGIRWWSWR